MPSELRGVVGMTVKFLPTDEDGAFDEASYRRLVDWMIDNGVGAVGSLIGHTYEYSDAERRRFAEILVEEVDERVPTVFGIMAWDLETTLKRVRDLEDLDIDVLYATGPPLDRPLSDDPSDIVDYFAELSDAVDKPVMICNSPAFWPGEMSPDVLEEISEVAPQIEYVMNCSKRTHVHQAVVEGLQDNRLQVLPGKSYNSYHQLASTVQLDETFVGMTGYLSGTLPGEHVAMFEAYRNGDMNEAARIWSEEILPVVNLLYGPGAGAQANPPPDTVVEDVFTGFSYLLNQLGVLDTPRNHYSRRSVSDYTKQEIDRYIERVNPSPVR